MCDTPTRVCTILCVMMIHTQECVHNQSIHIHTHITQINAYNYINYSDLLYSNTILNM